MSSIVTADADLSSLGVVLPPTHTGMVLAQPYLELTDQEPFRCTPQSRSRNLESLKAVLDVARTAPHGAPKTHFTLLPEYSIPGTDGIELIEHAISGNDWPKQTIVIGGIDGLSIQEYVTLAAAPSTEHPALGHPGNATNPASQWVNCGVIWVKAADGSVRRWLQPKLYPSWPEEDITNSRMFRGNTVFLFRGTFENKAPFRFAVLVCFDWIASVDGVTPWQALVHKLSSQAIDQKAELPISWIFVIQHNPRPSHHSFMNQINGFFDHATAANVRRDRACLIFANSAGRPTPGRVETHGHTSVVFAQQTSFTKPKCHVTFCNGGERFRGHHIIRHHKDCFFREGGACVHSFQQVNPNRLPGAPYHTIALQNVAVHPTNNLADPRVPSDSVPASVKWLNDELDTIQSLTANYGGAPLAAEIDVGHKEAVVELRSLAGNSAAQTVTLASAVDEEQDNGLDPTSERTADDWDSAESLAVVHLVHTLSILKVCCDRWLIGNSSPHGSLTTGTQEFDVAAVRGETHECCYEHSVKAFQDGRRAVLLVSRDENNDEWPRRFGSFVELELDATNTERDITNPHGILWRLGYRDLLEILRGCETAQEARERFHGELWG